MSSNAMRQVLRFLAIPLLLSLVFAFPCVTYGSQTAAVSISVPSSTIQPGEQFALSIAVDPNNSIAGTQFNLTFNPSMVTADSIQQGDLLTQNGASSYFFPGQIDNNSGTIAGVFSVITSPGQTVSTEGTLATITMTAGSKRGTCLFTLSNVVIVDPEGQPVAVTVGNRAVNIAAPAGTPSNPPDDGGNNGVIPPMGPVITVGKAITKIVPEIDDHKVKLTIPQDTIVRNASGQIVSSIVIRPSTESVAPAPESIPVSTIYDIEPSGTTFDPPATLAFNYDPAALPDGISGKSLYIALWDPVNNKWLDLGGTVDPVTQTVSLEVQHLSTYAIMVHSRPASFELSELSIDRREIRAGDPATVSLVVANAGDYAGTCRVSLELDDSAIESRAVTLGGLEKQIVQFTMTSDIAGNHTVGVGGLSVPFTVIKTPVPATFLTSDLAVSPSAGAEGDNLDASVRVTNSGDLSGACRVTLKIDGAEVQSREVQLDGGKSELVKFTIGAGPIGLHTVTVNNLTTSYAILGQVITEADNTPAEASEFPSTGQARPDVSPESMDRVVSWKTPAIMVGITAIVTMVLVTIVGIRRRQVLRRRYHYLPPRYFR
jgi:hypothetical protein